MNLFNVIINLSLVEYITQGNRHMYADFAGKVMSQNHV